MLVSVDTIFSTQKFIELEYGPQVGDDEMASMTARACWWNTSMS